MFFLHFVWCIIVSFVVNKLNNLNLNKIGLFTNQKRKNDYSSIITSHCNLNGILNSICLLMMSGIHFWLFKVFFDLAQSGAKGVLNQ